MNRRRKMTREQEQWERKRSLDRNRYRNLTPEQRELRRAQQRERWRKLPFEKKWEKSRQQLARRFTKKMLAPTPPGFWKSEEIPGLTAENFKEWWLKLGQDQKKKARKKPQPTRKRR